MTSQPPKKHVPFYDNPQYKKIAPWFECYVPCGIILAMLIMGGCFIAGILYGGS